MGSIPTLFRTVPQSFSHLPWVPFLPVGLLWGEHGSPPSALAKVWLSQHSQSCHQCREENSTSGEVSENPAAGGGWRRGATPQS